MCHNGLSSIEMAIHLGKKSWASQIEPGYLDKFYRWLFHEIFHNFVAGLHNIALEACFNLTYS